MARSEGGLGEKDRGFIPPVGYRRSELEDDLSHDKEMWVIRVPDEVDLRKLDGLTIPLEALTGASRDPLMTVDMDEAQYDLFQASAHRKDDQEDQDSQLIQMAGSAKSDGFVDHEFFQQERGVGIATDLNGIVPLIPTPKNTLKLAPKRVHRRMYLARRAPKSTPLNPVHAIPHQAHQQPWDKLQGRFTPAGARSTPSVSHKKSSQSHHGKLHKKAKQ
ncbi:hypothetical protein MYAM1_003799 [Malassezia yamatoensis]|uniref:Uncharacterized protein n=1 Tax=Malassezia yamatoensis TaxID=253288 RepID=A0AAJ6CJQ5_9BASI|nr:hypothetical protein MYAM1_003799 [Malassezia yamatoensis]